MKQDFGFRELVGYATPYRGTLLLIIALMLAESGVALLSPWLAGRFTDSMLKPAAAGVLPLQHLVPLWLLVLLCQQILSFSNQYLTGITGETMAAGMRARLYDHLQSLPLSYFHERRHGEVLTLITTDSAVISTFVSGTLTGLLPLGISFTGALVLMYLKSPFFALMAGVLVPFFFLVMKVLGRKIRPLSRQMMEQYGRTFSIVEENLSILPVIKAFTREKIESKRFAESNDRLLVLEKRYLGIQAMLAPAVRFLAAGAILFLLWTGAQQVETGLLSTGDLVSLLLYGMMLTRPLSGLAGVYGQIQHTRGAAQRLIDVFSVNPEPAGGKQALPPVRGDVVFSDVHFRYPKRGEILRGINAVIRAGETVAIVGENGAGKSTLVHLLLRFDDPQQGRITIDGININEVSVTSLRQQIGLVQQNVLLLNASVRENICFGRPGADLEEIRTAARNAHALDFIEQLPQGFDTLIGDQGVRLSGGQKQRLALARVLLKDPPILILDEATAMFDPQGEEGFIHECRELLRQRTVILITHRPASLALADRILQLKDGQLRPLREKSVQCFSLQACG